LIKVLDFLQEGSFIDRIRDIDSPPAIDKGPFIEKPTVMDKTKPWQKPLSSHSPGICDVRQGYAFVSVKCCPCDGGDIRKPEQMQNPIPFTGSFGDHGDLDGNIRMNDDLRVARSTSDIWHKRQSRDTESELFRDS
jgi:hypothetical protein